jgi:predicted RNA binding protein YcfA (HicA-like mRNA interferase family)
MNRKKLLRKALGGTKNLRFDEVVTLAQGFGFRLSRTSGSHHIFAHASIPELVNLQNVSSKAKPYQVRQLLRLVEKYNLQLEEDK